MATADSSDTEIELSSDDLVSLSHVKKIDAAESVPSPVIATAAAPAQIINAKPRQTSNARRAISRTAMFIGLMFATIAGAIAMYTHSQTNPVKRVQHTWKPAFPQPVGDTEPEPQEVAPQGPPVKYVNPFDRSEVFEFPPGTSRAAARDAVADILLQRAAERDKSARQ
jgi:hypothetical protein